MFRKRHKSNLIVIGVTGGIGNGKTTACKIFEEKGATIIDADAIGHELLADNQYIKRCVYDAFGEIIMDPDRSINRNRLGNLVFADPEKLARLNSIIHPQITMRIRNQINKLKSSTPEGMVVVDAALIVECSITGLFDYIVLLESQKKSRVTRMKKSMGLVAIDANARINAQLPAKEKEKFATHIIKNDGSLKDLRTEILKTIRDIKKTATAKKAAAT